MNIQWVRRAKIVCTLGPATFSPGAIENLIQTGMDVVRLNFSHGDYSIYDRVIRTIREKSHRLKKFIPIIQDLQGPKLRTGELENKEVELKRGQRLLITTKDVMGTEEIISVPFQPLPKLLKSGNPILIDDGLIELKVLRSKGHVIECRVVNGGILKEHKGVNIPYVKTTGTSLTLKDKKDLAFGIRKDVDFIALSFVRSSHDILELRKRIPKSKKIGIIAKIEKREAIDHFDEILEVSDGIMIARGDL
ncbi:MAG: pyruvate kinase, partial [Deltaproteobacteria bacterium]|nr:pyruvate kinase [Deltaproteobacteria bacterium]